VRILLLRPTTVAQQQESSGWTRWRAGPVQGKARLLPALRAPVSEGGTQLLTHVPHLRPTAPVFDARGPPPPHSAIPKAPLSKLHSQQSTLCLSPRCPLPAVSFSSSASFREALLCPRVHGRPPRGPKAVHVSCLFALGARKASLIDVELYVSKSLKSQSRAPP
jgi:hypothetical protein